MFALKKQQYAVAILRAYNRPTQRPARSWPDSSIGGALHLHRRCQGSNSRSGLTKNYQDHISRSNNMIYRLLSKLFRHYPM